MESKIPPKPYDPGICHSEMTETPLFPEYGPEKSHGCVLVKGHVGRHKCKCGATW